MFVKKIILVAILISSFEVFAKVNTQALSAKVIELRKEVELLNDEYKTEREKVLNELKALSIQKAELASNIRNEEIRRDQLDEKIGKLKKEISQSSIESKELTPILVSGMTSLKEYVEGSLPFKKKERLESISKLEERLNKKEISATKAANQLWAMIEDEKRLARETSLHKQTIPIGEKMHLAEVVKVGMLFLYFKTDAGKVGLAQQENNEWIYKTFTDEEKQRQTLAFMESLKKQIRTGYFAVPTEI